MTHFLGRYGRRLAWYVFQRRFGLVDRRLVEQYVGAHAVRKLHIGCGDQILPGWLNADLFPSSTGVLHLDARRTFPFDSEQVDYVFTEHMIEHVSYAQGARMLAECFRVLRENGRIRVSTPDLSFLFDLRCETKSALQQAYVKWATNQFIPGAPEHADTFVINNFVRAWGHQFIYDEKTLRASMQRAGFAAITRCGLGESHDESLRNLENRGRLPAGFLALETFTLEGTKTRKAHG